MSNYDKLIDMFPCKVGDTIYEINTISCVLDTVDGETKQKIKQDCEGRDGICQDCMYEIFGIEEHTCTQIIIDKDGISIRDDEMSIYDIEDIFIDRSKAEKKLKEIQEKTTLNKSSNIS